MPHEKSIQRNRGKRNGKKTPQTETVRIEVKVPGEIPLVGERRPAFVRDAALPASLRNHPLIAGQRFLALPERFVGILEKELAAKITSSPNWEIENEVSHACGDFFNVVGFFDGEPIHFSLLQPKYSLGLSPELAAEAGWEQRNTAQLQRTQVVYEQRMRWMYSIARGYLGWLLTNERYLKEEVDLFATRNRSLQKNGRETGATSPATGQRDAATTTNEGEPASDRREQAAAFLRRWQLESLVVPGLPKPLLPLMAGAVPTSILAGLMTTGGIFILPDTFPIPSRDEYRRLLDDAIHPSESDKHLADWHRRVTARHLAKHEIRRFGRIFELGHYWKLIFARHAESLENAVGKLISASAQWFGVSEATIKSDVKIIRERIGKAWPR